MRFTLLILALLVPCLFLACGGDDEGTPGDRKEDQTGTKKPGETDEPAPEPTLELSPEAKELAKAYSEVKKIRTSNEDQQQAAKDKIDLYPLATLPGDAKFFLGRIYGLAKDDEGAFKALEAFIEECPENTKNFKTGITDLILNRVKSGNADGAVKYLDLFTTSYPRERQNQAILQRKVARVMLKEGDFSGAGALYEKAAENGNGNAPQGVIECLWAQGEYEKALTKANEYVEAFPHPPHAKRVRALVALAEKMGAKAPPLDVEAWADEREFRFDGLDSTEGEVTLVYFWNLSHPYSEAVEKLLQLKLFDKYEDQGLNIVGLSKHYNYIFLEGMKVESLVKQGKDFKDLDAAGEVNQLMEWRFNFKTRWPLGLCVDDRNHQAYGGTAVPSFAFIGKKGNYRFRFSGRAMDTFDILAQVAAVLLGE